jgi:hypothetical protein
MKISHLLVEVVHVGNIISKTALLQDIILSDFQKIDITVINILLLGKIIYLNYILDEHTKS